MAVTVNDVLIQLFTEEQNLKTRKYQNYVEQRLSSQPPGLTQQPQPPAHPRDTDLKAQFRRILPSFLLRAFLNSRPGLKETEPPCLLWPVRQAPPPFNGSFGSETRGPGGSVCLSCFPRARIGPRVLPAEPRPPLPIPPGLLWNITDTCPPSPRDAGGTRLERAEVEM